MTMKLPFRLDLNASLSNVLYKPKQQVHYNKELAFTINRIYKHKLRQIFKSIKNQQLISPNTYFKYILTSLKQSKKQSKISYLPYNVQSLPNQVTVPKTAIFNLRVKALKMYGFIKLKSFFTDIKQYQCNTILQNRQSQLLNHLIPKIQEKIYSIGFRKIMDYSRQQRGKTLIVNLLNKLSNNIMKRVHYSDFLIRLKNNKVKQQKRRLSIKKMTKIMRLSQKYVLQTSFRRVQLYKQLIGLEQKLSQKKQRISKIYDLNVQRTVILQKQRQLLRNLKYKLDQQSIQKNHILTDKKRSLLLMKTKSIEQNKQLNDIYNGLSTQVYKLQNIYNKQLHIIKTLQSKRISLNQLKRSGIDFQSITITIYKAIHDLGQQDINGFTQIVNHHQLKWNHVSNVPLLNNIQSNKDYQCRKISLLQKIIKSYQNKTHQSSLNASRVKPLISNNSTSQLKVSPSVNSLKGSRVVNNNSVGVNNSLVGVNNNSLVNKSKVIGDPVELIRVKQEYGLLFGLISLVLNKSYEIKIKQAISAQIQQLSQLLASDIKQHNQEH